MPCDGSYMNPNSYEIELSKVACLLNELEGISIDKRSWEGYHPTVYNKHLSTKVRDHMVFTLCKRLQHIDVSKYSLEMQIWWRDHQEEDRKRLKKELKQKKEKENIEKALNKLTPYERKLLGF